MIPLISLDAQAPDREAAARLAEAAAHVLKISAAPADLPEARSFIAEPIGPITTRSVAAGHRTLRCSEWRSSYSACGASVSCWFPRSPAPCACPRRNRRRGRPSERDLLAARVRAYDPLHAAGRRSVLESGSNGLSVARPRAALGTDGFGDLVLRRDLDYVSVPVRQHRRAVDVDWPVVPRASDDFETRDAAGDPEAEGIAAAHDHQPVHGTGPLFPLCDGPRRTAGAVAAVVRV